MRIAIGCDHGGFALKQEILPVLGALGHAVHDFGAYDCTPSDYPDVAKQVAKAVAAGEYDAGVLLCGTGIGVDMAANKVHGIRAALCHDTFSAHSSREHNNANILCMGGRVLGPGLARDIVTTWLAANYTGEERHRRRLAKVSELDAER